MKKVLPILAITALILMVYVISCTRNDNPFLVNPDNSNVEGYDNLMGPGGFTIEPSYNAQALPLNRPIFIFFGRYMDESTVTTDNISIYRMSGNDEISVDITISYNPGTRYAKILAEDGEFTDDAAYVLTMSTGLEDSYDQPLDGNGNGLADSSIYDLYRSPFYTGTGNSDLPDFSSPTISSYSPSTEITQLAMDSATFQISVSFSGGDIDTTDLTNDIITLYRLSNANGIPTDTTVVTNVLTRASRSPFSVSYRMGSPDDTTRLVRGGRYLVEFNASAISDVNGNPLLWGNEVNDGSIANLFFGFLMEPEAGEDIVPPRVQNVSISQFENNWRAVATFNEVMDTTTFNSDNFAL
ncbi:MAG: hypothetical protein GY855_16385, partial [candidate division Zixibacteria bacterium]|nr:hypothetical protein [candidate division Zixibacteria bacterium]